MLFILKTDFGDNPVFYIIIAIVIGYLIFQSYFSREAVVKRKIKKTEEKKISELKDGDVAKITGVVKYFGKTLRAPISGRKCAYYHVHVEEHRSSGKSSRWVDLINEEVSGSVVIKNGNDYAVVSTLLVNSHIIKDAERSSGFLKDATVDLENYLKKHGHKSTGLFGFNDTLRYNEGILEEGETIAVVGKVRWLNKNEIKHNIPSQKVLIIGKDNESPLYLTDDPDVTQ